MKAFINTALLSILIPTLAFGAATRTLTADQIKNSAQTLTYTVPTATGTLITKEQERVSNQSYALNLLLNPRFEDTPYNTDWATTGGTVAAAATTNIFASQGLTWDSTAAAQAFESNLYTIPEGFRGNNCEGSIYIKTPSGTATHTIRVVDNTAVVLATATVVSSTSFRKQTLTFPCPTTTSMAISILSVNANEPLIAMDEGFLGLARNVGSTAVSAASTVTRYTTGSGTYTVPSNVYQIKVRMVGGGGGGSSSGSASLSNGSNGTSTTFGSSLLTATFGAGGGGSSAGGSGGTATVNSPATMISNVTGGQGQGAQVFFGISNSGPVGGAGGTSIFGGAGQGNYFGTGLPAAANSGAGGGGGSGPVSGTNQVSGSGGGAGGGLEAIIATSGGAQFAYGVGTGGAGGTPAGTSGHTGGAGAAGVIEITEYKNSNQAVIAANQQRTPTVTRYTSGSGTYTTPAGVTYLRVRGCGSGGGGSSSGTAATNNGGAGASTTFGSSLLTGAGGAGGTIGTGTAAGGTATVNAPAIGIPIAGANGQGAQYNNLADGTHGGQGGSTIFGGGGAGGSYGAAGAAAIANSGSGGGGGGGNSAVAGVYAGGGGGAGGCFDALISAPGATFAYGVGASGAGGGAGTNGFAGGASGLGQLEITEFYGYTVAILANSVSTGNNNGDAIARATVTGVCSASPCTVTNNNGAVSSITRAPTGAYTVNFTAGTFSAAPVCTASSKTQYAIIDVGVATSTSQALQGLTTGAAAADTDISLLCIGPR